MKLIYIMNKVQHAILTLLFIICIMIMAIILKNQIINNKLKNEPIEIYNVYYNDKGIVQVLPHKTDITKIRLLHLDDSTINTVTIQQFYFFKKYKKLHK